MENNTSNIFESKEEINTTVGQTKFCKHCGEKIPFDAVICMKCGRQVEELKGSKENIVINNNNVASASATVVGMGGRARSKWVSILLCLFLGVIGGHKFYEGKILMGIIYLFTAGLFGIGIVIDLIALIFKPNTYYV